MVEMNDKEIMQIIINSQEKAFRTAVETAIRTGTKLIGTRKGKVVKIDPRDKLISKLLRRSEDKATKSSKKKKSS